MTVQNVKTPSSSALTNTPTQSAADSSKLKKTGLETSGARAYARTENAPTVKDAVNVQISQKAKEMSLAHKVADETPDVREDKVAKYKDLIARGEYKPDAGKIANGMLHEAMRDEIASDPKLT